MATTNEVQSLTLTTLSAVCHIFGHSKKHKIM